jgi:hypothetical protein
MTSDDELGSRIRRLAEQLPVRIGSAPEIQPGRRAFLPLAIAGAVAAVLVAAVVYVVADRANHNSVTPIPPVSDMSTDTTHAVETSVPAETTTPATVTPTSATVDSTATSTTSIVAATATSIPTTTPAAPAVDFAGVTLPIVYSDLCSPTWGRMFAGGMQVGAPLERVSSKPIAAQLIGPSTASLTQPFVLVERFVTDFELPFGFTSDVDINGSAARVDWVDGTDSGAITWRLPDGSEAFLRSHGFSRDDALALSRALIQRPADSNVPGFDAPPGNPFGVTVLDETNGNIVSPRRAASSCRLGNGSTVTVSVFERYLVAVAAFIIDHPESRLLAARDVLGADDRIVVLTGQGDASPGGKDIAEYTAEFMTQIRQATPQEWATLLLYPTPGELDGLDLPADTEAEAALAGQTFDIRTIANALVDLLRTRVPDSDLDDTTFTVTRLIESPRFVVTMNYLDASTVGAQWILQFEEVTGGLRVVGIRQAIKCRDGSAHEPGYPCT